MIPKELKNAPCWVVAAPSSKEPLRADNPRLPASSTNPATWATYDKAAAVAKKLGYYVGFVFSMEYPYTGIDMDHHVNEDTLKFFGSYAETSKSGDGVHVIVRGKKPAGYGSKVTGDGVALECYDHARYFIFTGKALPGYTEVADGQDKLNEWVPKNFPRTACRSTEPDPEDPPTSPDDDKVLLEKIRHDCRSASHAAKFNALWEGDIAGLPAPLNNPSCADMSLMSALKFWTRGNKTQTFRMMAESGLYRDKHDRDDYYERTWSRLRATEQYAQDGIEIPQKSDVADIMSVSDDDAWAAVDGTVLGEMIHLFSAAYDESSAIEFPFGIALGKALSLAGASMCLPIDWVPADGIDLSAGEAPESEEHEEYGVERARFRIALGGGMLMNFYVLIPAASAIGKDLGGLLPNAAKRAGIPLVGGGSGEGIMDTLCDIRTSFPVIELTEMQNYLDPKHYMSKTASIFTEIFNKHFFDIKLSKNGGRKAHTRKSDYSVPTVVGYIQPNVLSAIASKLAVDSGFFGRMLITSAANYTDEMFLPARSLLIEEKKRLAAIVKSFTQIRGERTVDLTRFTGIRSSKTCAEHSHGYRLAHEYSAKIAVLMSIRIDEFGVAVLPEVIPDEAYARTGTVLRWFMKNWLLSIGSVGATDLDKLCDKFLMRAREWMLRNKAETIQLRILHGLLHDGTEASERERVAEELVSRGYFRKPFANDAKCYEITELGHARLDSPQCQQYALENTKKRAKKRGVKK